MPACSNAYAILSKHKSFVTITGSSNRISLSTNSSTGYVSSSVFREHSRFFSRKRCDILFSRVFAFLQHLANTFGIQRATEPRSSTSDASAAFLPELHSANALFFTITLHLIFFFFFFFSFFLLNIHNIAISLYIKCIHALVIMDRNRETFSALPITDYEYLRVFRIRGMYTLDHGELRNWYSTKGTRSFSERTLKTTFLI